MDTDTEPDFIAGFIGEHRKIEEQTRGIKRKFEDVDGEEKRQIQAVKQDAARKRSMLKAQLETCEKEHSILWSKTKEKSAEIFKLDCTTQQSSSPANPPTSSSTVLPIIETPQPSVGPLETQPAGPCKAESATNNAPSQTAIEIPSAAVNQPGAHLANDMSGQVSEQDTEPRLLYDPSAEQIPCGFDTTRTRFKRFVSLGFGVGDGSNDYNGRRILPKEYRVIRKAYGIMISVGGRVFEVHCRTCGANSKAKSSMLWRCPYYIEDHAKQFDPVHKLSVRLVSYTDAMRIAQGRAPLVSIYSSCNNDKHGSRPIMPRHNKKKGGSKQILTEMTDGSNAKQSGTEAAVALAGTGEESATETSSQSARTPRDRTSGRRASLPKGFYTDTLTSDDESNDSDENAVPGFDFSDEFVVEDDSQLAKRICQHLEAGGLIKDL